MAPQDDVPRQPFQRTRKLPQEGSVRRQLNDLRVALDASKCDTVRTFYEHMPEAVKEYDAWRMGYAKAIDKASEIGSCLHMAFTGDAYTREEIYDDFTGDTFINEVAQLKSGITHAKAIKGMTLAQDASRDFAQWERFHKDIADGGAAISTLGGYGALAASLTGSAICPVLIPTAAVAAVAFQIWFRWNRAVQNAEDKMDLANRARTLSDITEVIQEVIMTLNQVGVHVEFIIKYQKKAKDAKKISNLLKDKIARSAEKMVRACSHLRDEL